MWNGVCNSILGDSRTGGTYVTRTCATIGKTDVEEVPVVTEVCVCVVESPGAEVLDDGLNHPVEGKVNCWNVAKELAQKMQKYSCSHLYMKK